MLSSRRVTTEHNSKTRRSNIDTRNCYAHHRYGAHRYDLKKYLHINNEILMIVQIGASIGNSACAAQGKLIVHDCLHCADDSVPPPYRRPLASTSAHPARDLRSSHPSRLNDHHVARLSEQHHKAPTAPRGDTGARLSSAAVARNPRARQRLRLSPRSSARGSGARRMRFHTSRMETTWTNSARTAMRTCHPSRRVGGWLEPSRPYAKRWTRNQMSCRSWVREAVR